MLTPNSDTFKRESGVVYANLLTIGSGANALRFVDDNENWTVGGQTYTAYNFQLSDDSTGSTGEIPTQSLQISNIGGIVNNILQAVENIDELPVTIALCRKGAAAPDDSFSLVVDGLTYDQSWVTLPLTIGVKFTGVYLRKYGSCCPFVYKDWRCRASSSLQGCNKTAHDCKARGNYVRFGGIDAEL